MNKIRSYVPESVFFDNKDQSGCRIFHDNCAIINAVDNYRLIAARGIDIPIGEPFFDTLSISDEETDRLQKFLQTQEEYLLLSCQKSTLIVFAALLQNTGLLLVVQVSYCKKDVQKSIENARRDAFSPIFHPDNIVFQEEPRLQEKLAEIFYYTDRILQPPPTLGLWTRLLLIANFVGCRLEHVSLSASFPTLPKKHQDVLTAFLLCAFLIFRHRTGTNRVTSPHENVGKVQPIPEEDESLFSLYLHHLPIKTSRKKLPLDEAELINFEQSPLAFLLSLPCFKSIRQTIQDGKITFEIPVAQSTGFGALSTMPFDMVILIDLITFES